MEGFEFEPADPLSKRDTASELRRRIAEAYDYAEELEDKFFEDLLSSSELLREYLKRQDQIIDCPVQHLKRRDITSESSMEKVLYIDIQVIRRLKEYVLCLKRHDEDFRKKVHRPYISKLETKMDGILTLLKQIASSSDEDKITLVRSDSSRLSRADRRKYDFKIVADFVPVLRDLKLKFEEIETIFIIYDRK